MKKFNLLLFVAAASLVLFSCKGPDKPSPDPATKFTLSISGGEAVEIKDSDMTRNITIETIDGKTVDRDITIALTTSDTEYSVLTAEEIVLKKDKKSVSTQITFPVDMFTEDDMSIEIEVTATTTDKNVTINPSVTIFTPYTGETPPPPTDFDITVAIDKTALDTTDEAGTSTITFTLNEAMEEDQEINWAYGTASNIIDPGKITITDSPLTIPAGELTATLTVTVAKGTAGSVPLTFSVNNPADVTLKITSLSINCTIVLPPVISISTAGGTAVTVKGADAVKTITVKLDKAYTKGDIVVDLEATSSNTLNGTLSATSVTIPSGTTTQTVTITFPLSVFASSTDTATVTVTATTDSELEITSDTIVYTVKGYTLGYAYPGSLEVDPAI